MLILRRKVDEAILIDGQIRIQILGIEGERVKVGIAAPTELNIVREELLLPPGVQASPALAGDARLPGAPRPAASLHRPGKPE